MAYRRQLPRRVCLEIHGPGLSNEISDWDGRFVSMEQERFFLRYHAEPDSRGIEVCSIYAGGKALPETGSACFLDAATIAKLILVAPPDLRDVFLKGFCERRLTGGVVMSCHSGIFVRMSLCE